MCREAMDILFRERERIISGGGSCSGVKCIGEDENILM